MFFKITYAKGGRWHVIEARRKIGGRLSILSACGLSVKDDDKTVTEADDLPSSAPICHNCHAIVEG